MRTRHVPYRSYRLVSRSSPLGVPNCPHRDHHPAPNCRACRLPKSSILAEAVGFEPTVVSLPRRFSRARTLNNQQLLPTIIRRRIRHLLIHQLPPLLAVVGGTVPNLSREAVRDYPLPDQGGGSTMTVSDWQREMPERYRAYERELDALLIRRERKSTRKNIRPAIGGPYGMARIFGCPKLRSYGMEPIHPDHSG